MDDILQNKELLISFLALDIAIIAAILRFLAYKLSKNQFIFSNILSSNQLILEIYNNLTKAKEFFIDNDGNINPECIIKKKAALVLVNSTQFTDIYEEFSSPSKDHTISDYSARMAWLNIETYKTKLLYDKFNKSKSKLIHSFLSNYYDLLQSLYHQTREINMIQKQNKHLHQVDNEIDADLAEAHLINVAEENHLQNAIRKMFASYNLITEAKILKWLDHKAKF